MGNIKDLLDKMLGVVDKSKDAKIEILMGPNAYQAFKQEVGGMQDGYLGHVVVSTNLMPSDEIYIGCSIPFKPE